MFVHFSWRLLVAITVSAAGGSFHFYNLVVINVSQDVVSAWINQTYIRRGIQHSELWLTMYWSTLVGFLHVGAAIGCAVSGVVADKLGRQKPLILNGLSGVLAAVMVGIAKGASLPELLFFSRLLFGISLGMACAHVPMYATETAPVRYRGTFGTIHLLMGSLGELFGYVAGLPQILGTDSLWPFLFALPGIPALVMTIVLPFCHDSPGYLMIMKKDNDRAYKSLVFFLGSGNVYEAYRALSQEANYTDRYSKGNSTFISSVINLFKLRELRLPLLISILVVVGKQFTGIFAVLSYSTHIFQETGMDPDMARLGTVGCGIVCLAFTCGAAYLIEKAGRRKLLIFRTVGCLITLILFTIFKGLAEDIIPSPACGPLFVVTLMVFIAIFSAGSPIPYIIPCELFTQAYRPQAVSVTTFTIFFLGFLISTIYLPFSKLVGVTWSFIPFIVVNTFVVSALIYLLPETKNKTVEEITSDLRRGGYYRSRKTRHMTGNKSVQDSTP